MNSSTPKIPVEELLHKLLSDSHLSVNYLFLVITSCLIATFGLLSNSVAVIIGAMIVAPIMFPLRGLAFGILERSNRLVLSSLLSIIAGSFIAVTIAFLIGSMINVQGFASEVMARTNPTILDLGIALAAGAVAGFAQIQPRIADTVAGTAIAVALMPPLCVIGLTLSAEQFDLSWGATLLYFTNLLGITFACMLAFTLAGYIHLNKLDLPFIFMLSLMAVIVAPLAISFYQLVQHSRLEHTLREILVNKTFTLGSNVEVVNIRVSWSKEPAEANIYIRTSKTITPYQVTLLESFVEKQLDKKFILILEVSEYSEIRALPIEKKSPDL